MKLAKLKKDKFEHSNRVRERVIFVMYRLLEKKKDIRSRKAFADRIHTTPAAISHWEALNARPTTENLVDLCIEFSISADWLLLGKGNMYGEAEVISRLRNLEDRVQYLEQKSGIKEKDYRKNKE